MRTTVPHSLIPALVLAGALCACSSPSGPPADRITYETSEAPAPTLDDMTDAQRRQQNIEPLRRNTVDGRDMTEGERIAWFQSHGTYPQGYQAAPYLPPADQGLGYVDDSSAWDYIWPGLVIAGAAWGLYEIKRHND